jgi:hypothetical protein
MSSPCFAHDLIRKPVATFRDHARGANSRNRSISVSDDRRPIIARSIE